MICEDCEKTPSRQACSKDCAHHLSRGPSGRSSSGSLTRPRDGEPHA
jgi:hypothetical protein